MPPAAHTELKTEAVARAGAPGMKVPVAWCPLVLLFCVGRRRPRPLSPKSRLARYRVKQRRCQNGATGAPPLSSLAKKRWPACRCGDLMRKGLTFLVFLASRVAASRLAG